MVDALMKDLISAGIVERQEVRGKIGRPKVLYLLADNNGRKEKREEPEILEKAEERHASNLPVSHTPMR